MPAVTLVMSSIAENTGCPKRRNYTAIINDHKIA
jgi:hypothetical protein